MDDAELRNLERDVWEAGRRLDTHDRALGHLRDEVRALQRAVDGLTKAEEIADAVTAALSRERRQWFNGWRRLAAATGGAILIAPALHDLVLWVSG